MLSAVIVTRHSYPAVPLAGQLADQWSVHPGPLVASSPVSRSADYIFILLRCVRSWDGGILPIHAVALMGAIPHGMSLRIFQRKSLRGQTKHLIQFFFCLSLPAHIVFILYEQKKIDNLTYVVRLHSAKRLLFKQFACLDEQFRLFLFKTKIRLKYFKSFPHLRETIDAQFRHTIVPFGNVSTLEPRSHPRERCLVATVLVKTDGRHKAHPLGRIRTLL